MMAVLAHVLLWWLPTAAAFAGLPFMSAGLRTGLSLASLLWFATLYVVQLQASWWQNPWRFEGLIVGPEPTQVVPSLASAVVIFVGLRLLPAMSALALRSLGAADEDPSGLEDGASTPENSLVTLHFMLLVTLAVLSDQSGGFVSLVLPDPGSMGAATPMVETTALGSWLMELLQASVTKAVGVVAPFLLGGMLAELIVLSVRGARRARRSHERWRPAWVLGVLMLVTWLEVGSGLTPNSSRLSSSSESATEPEASEAP